MSGLRKAKKYDWKDSNMALFGSDTEKQVKKESAETEPAWKNAGTQVGVKIWRINKFKVEAWPEEDYGKFYSGDSYIILNTYKEKDSDELNYDVHFWIGQYSTQDEYGTAAYKTVELDTFLDDKPIQHREVQGHESPLFKKYFQCITYLEGGADTGFRRVLPEEYKPRLFHVSKLSRNSIEVKEVPITRKLKSNDVYILDTGSMFYQWNGKDSSRDETFKAAQRVQDLVSERKGRANKEVLEEEEISGNHPFNECLETNATDDVDGDEEAEEDVGYVSKLLKVSDEDGSLDTEEVKDGSIALSDLQSEDVYIIDQGRSVHVWIGKKASIDERRNAMTYAHTYLCGTDHALAAISVVSEGQKFMIPNVA